MSIYRGGRQDIGFAMLEGHKSMTDKLVDNQGLLNY